MKLRALTFICLTFAVCLSSAIGTEQAPDQVMFRGKMESIIEFPLDSHINSSNYTGPKFDIDRTDLYRGYFAQWALFEDTLYLVSLEASIDGEAVVIDEVFNRPKLPLAATWYTGYITIARGERIGWKASENGEYMGEVYETHFQHKIVKGKLVEVLEIKNSFSSKKRTVSRESSQSGNNLIQSKAVESTP